MKKSALLWVLVTLSMAAGAQARSRSFDRQLMRLSPDERVEQRCNKKAATLLSREHRLKSPDEVVAYAFADTKQKGVMIDAPGAAIRDKGEWYRMSYTCRTTADGLGIVSFDYRLGDKVPRSDWEKHYLSPP